jgi:peptidyl-prolyl cis-trans isomerase D
MFEFIRTHQRLMQFLLLLLILPSFVLVGVSSYNERGGNDGVATVDGRKDHPAGVGIRPAPPDRPGAPA